MCTMALKLNLIRCTGGNGGVVAYSGTSSVAPAGGEQLVPSVRKIASSWIVTNLDIFAKIREAIMEATFLDAYGSPWLQAAVGLKAEHTDTRRVRFAR